MSVFFKMIQVFFLAMIKYFYAPLYGLAIKLEFWHTYFSLIAGGVLAFMLYYHITRLMQIYAGIFPPVYKKILPAQWINGYVKWKMKRKEKRKKRRKFTRWNKFLVKIKKVYGMWGIVLLTPVLLSLPVGAFLLRKYYPGKRPLLIMVGSIVIEGFVLCLVYSGIGV